MSDAGFFALLVLTVVAGVELSDAGFFALLVLTVVAGVELRDSLVVVWAVAVGAARIALGRRA